MSEMEEKNDQGAKDEKPNQLNQQNMANIASLINDIRGRTRAAILLGFFPPDTSKMIVNHLDTYEREILLKEITNMPKYDGEIVEMIVMDYLGFIKGNNMGVYSSGAEFAMKLLEGAVPDEELEEMMGRIYSNNARPFDTLKRIKDVGPLLTFLQGEDAQTIAVIASHMKPSQAAELIESLPEEKMVEVSIGVANMEQTNKDILMKIEKHLNKKLENFITEDQNQTDGIKTLVNILNNVNRGTEKALFEELDKVDEELSKEVKDNMFVFEDMVKLDNQQLQVVLNKITDNELIAKALRLAPEELKEKFKNCMSQGRKDMVEDEDEGLGKMRMSDVEEAQQSIANIVKELEKAGDIVISRGDDEVII